MGSELKILVLEDNALDVQLMERQLKQSGLVFVAKCVSSNESFQKELKEFVPDLILADYRLPGFDGTEALAMARDLCPEVPFIMVSGVVKDEVAERALQSGATDYIFKDRLVKLAPAVWRALQEADNRLRREQAEKTAKETERSFFAVLDTLPTITFIHQDGKFRYVNSAAEQTLGYSREELLARDSWGAIPPGEQIPGRYEFKMTRKDGEDRWLDCTTTMIEFQGQPAVFGSALDITERKRTEETLRASEERFRQVTESIREVFWMTDLEKNRMVYISPGYAEVWGRTCESLYA